MAKQQRTEVAPPLKNDKELLDFASVVQSNLADLFDVAHEHSLRTTVPTSSEGSVGDLVLVNTNSQWYIYAKVNTTTWLRTAALV